MPYIGNERRVLIDSFLCEEFCGPTSDLVAAPADAGELNYAISRLLLADNFDWETYGKVLTVCTFYLQTKELRYQRINDVLGALDGAKREYARRVKQASRRNFVALILKSVADELYPAIAEPFQDSKILESGDLPYDQVN